ncbi:(Fe-S)-binding protein [Lysobacter solisilvae]|uniref:Glycolate oxidase iron-sulfur subunit n=1 Tax=Agrilutibacter solisilvae TaxID=2763317 RepID=A0A974Y1L4_9GAMM|nr:(Fe-S)-binding protein [Lysobacter solisilvae]
MQCGLCLPSCPTYGRSALESESPRGRIALARAWALETIPPSPAGETHLDQCLGCRRCEAVCPAGVEYGHLLVLARQRQRDRRPPGWLERVVLALAARPAWLRRLLRTYQRLYGVLPARLHLLARPPPAPGSPAADRAPASNQHPTPAGGERVALFSGCVADVYEAPLRRAVTRLCAALDVAVVSVPRQACCGSLHAHAGDVPASQALQATNRAAFDGVATVLSLATGCHEAVAQALATPGTPRVHDASAWIAARADRLDFQPTPLRVALHLPCTQRNVVGSVDDLRRLLRNVPQLEVVELDAGLGCCGAAGLQMLRDPATAAEYRAPLLDQFARSGAQLLLSANIGCRLHLAGGGAAPVLHPLEFLASALAAGASH